MRQVQIDLTLVFIVPESKFNVNGLLLGVRKASAEIFFALLKALVAAVEEMIIGEMMAQHPERYVRNGYQAHMRQLRTSLGPFWCRLAQLYDKVEKKTVVPLRASGFLPRNRRYTDEAMEAGIGQVVHVSYRCSSKEIARIREEAPAASAMTLHRRLQEFAREKCQWPDMKKVPYRFLMVDGTKVRLQGNGGAAEKDGEMRWAMASLGEKKPFEPVGFWIDKTWQQIRADLDRRLDYERLEVLFSDGGQGIEQAFLAEGMLHQRCVVHGRREFAFMLYADKLKKAEQLELRTKLASIPVFHFNKEKLEALRPDDAPRIKAQAAKTREDLQEMVTILDPQKYPRAHAYVKNFTEDIGTFFAWWLDRKTAIPMDTNVIESAIGRVKNRIWEVGKRWSDQGLLNWLQVTLNKVFHPAMWRQLWSEYLSLNPEFQLVSKHVTWKWA